jgi:hypothetical protein
METKQYSFKDLNGTLDNSIGVEGYSLAADERAGRANTVEQTEPEKQVIDSEFRPIAVSISTNDIQVLYATNTSPYMYQQLILAKLKDAGCPAIEGAAILKLTHGALTKVKDNPLKPEESFCYVWLPQEYVAAIAAGDVGMPC